MLWICSCGFLLESYCGPGSLDARRWYKGQHLLIAVDGTVVVVIAEVSFE